MYHIKNTDRLLVYFTIGWERMVLQILFLGPSNLLEPNASFAQMSQKLIVSPIVKTLVFSKVPEKVIIVAIEESCIKYHSTDTLLEVTHLLMYSPPS